MDKEELFNKINDMISSIEKKDLLKEIKELLYGINHTILSIYNNPKIKCTTDNIRRNKKLNKVWVELFNLINKMKKEVNKINNQQGNLK